MCGIRICWPNSNKMRKLIISIIINMPLHISLVCALSPESVPVRAHIPFLLCERHILIFGRDDVHEFNYSLSGWMQIEMLSKLMQTMNFEAAPNHHSTQLFIPNVRIAFFDSHSKHRPIARCVQNGECDSVLVHRTAQKALHHSARRKTFIPCLAIFVSASKCDGYENFIKFLIRQMSPVIPGQSLENIINEEVQH